MKGLTFGRIAVAASLAIIALAFAFDLRLAAGSELLRQPFLMIVMGIAAVRIFVFGGKSWPKCARARAIVAGVFCLVYIGTIAFFVVHPPGRHKHAHWEPRCSNNLKQMGIVFKMFTNESEGGVYPIGDADSLVVDIEDTTVYSPIYPEFLTDLRVLICPSDSVLSTVRKRLDKGEQFVPEAQSYYYLGYAVTNDAELRAFADVFRARMETGSALDNDIVLEDGQTIRRLQEGVERYFITDINNPASEAQAGSSIPVMWDRVRDGDFNHEPSGANVLFLDGHVEFIAYPGRFPMTEAAVRIMEEMEE